VLKYPVILERDTNNTIRVEFPDVPEANTFGEDEDEALSIYIDDRRDIPKPSPVKKRGKFVIVPALSEAKLALYSAMRAREVGKAELARRLNCHLPQVDRLLDLMHSSRLDQLEAAFRALGLRLGVEIEEAA
jgi:antitoxin HicB